MTKSHPCAPRNFLSPHTACILLTEKAQTAFLEQENIAALQSLPRIAVSKDESAPWRLSTLTNLFATTERRQLIIYSNRLLAFEIALCLMGTENRFKAYFCCPDPNILSSSSIHRLWQTGTVVLSEQEACNELELYLASGLD